jgi:hypothetical protein
MTDTKVAALERELLGMQEMLFFVLQAVGHPVEVTKETMVATDRKDQMINIDDDLARDVFVFSISQVPSEVEDAE